MDCLLSTTGYLVSVFKEKMKHCGSDYRAPTDLIGIFRNPPQSTLFVVIIRATVGPLSSQNL